MAEVEYAEMTPDGQIRHATFALRGLTRPPRHQARRPACVEASRRAREGSRSRMATAVIDPSTGLTKLDLVRYYESVAESILPHLKGRPGSLVRGPNGVDGQLFFQKHGGVGIEGMTQLDASLWPEHDALLEVDGRGTRRRRTDERHRVPYLELHFTEDRHARPDDLRPGPGQGHALEPGAGSCDAGALASDGTGAGVLAEDKRRKGPARRRAAGTPLRLRHRQGLLRRRRPAPGEAIPARFVGKSGPANRIGKIFVDYLRNGHGATTAAAFSARARPGLGVSMPVSWDDLSSLGSGAEWTIRNAREYLSFRKRDPWSDYWKSAQSLTEAMKTLSFNTKRKEKHS